MSTFKRTKVVMLPTKEKGAVVIRKDKPNVIMQEKHSCWGWYGDPNSKYYSKEHQYYHLYFLLDDDLKEGDWVYSTVGNTFGQLNTLTDHERKTCKKIIATTDKSLTITASIQDEVNALYYQKYLPEPSQGFIKKYCEKGGIDEVMVEYDLTHSDHAYNGFEEILKVSSDNTITIKPVKDSWNRIEVENLILQFANDAGQDESLLHHYGGIFKDAREWINQKL